MQSVQQLEPSRLPSVHLRLVCFSCGRSRQVFGLHSKGSLSVHVPSENQLENEQTDSVFSILIFTEMRYCDTYQLNTFEIESMEKYR